MPTYDYACEACGHVFEHWQSMTDPKLKTCPKCKKKKLVRLMGKGAGVIFRGSGFYETDYKRNRSPAPATSESEGSSDAASSSSGDSSSKDSSSRDSSSKDSSPKPVTPSKPASGDASPKDSSPKPSAPSKSSSRRKGRSDS